MLGSRKRTAVALIGTSLHTTTIGRTGPPVAFCHGVFGQGKNWASIAKALDTDAGPRHRSILIDMPNHGRSDWTHSLSYTDMADQLAALLEPHAPLAVVGHSMGGKAVMNLALRYPDLVERLVVVDMSPVRYPGEREFHGLVDAMQGLDLEDLPDRRTAEEQLAEQIPNRSIRQFLLQNLHRSTGADGPSWSWRLNLDLISKNLDALADWEEPADAEPYPGPVLWIGGAKADYVQPEHSEPMKRLFPRARQVIIKDAGHWVHSETPEIFTSVLRHFLAQAL
jgi:pimeloyl-ACP methyl ester carboxylesterase